MAQLALPLSEPQIAYALTIEAQDEQVRQLMAHAHQSFPLRRPARVEWRRFRTTAGTATFHTQTIALSRSILDSSEKLTTIFLHEYAHLLAYERAGRAGRGHGAAWQKAMRDLGLNPEVHHRYECKRNQPRQVVVYECRKCGAAIERKRRLPGRRKYAHVGCGGVIRFVTMRIENLPALEAEAPKAGSAI